MLQSELTLVSIILAREPIDTAAWLTQETTWSATAAGMAGWWQHAQSRGR